MALSYNDNAYSLKFEILSKTPDIGGWELYSEETEESIFGNGFIELLIEFGKLREDQINVIFVKNLNIFELIGENFIVYEEEGFFAMSDLTFLQLKVSETIELRSWDSFLDKEEDCKTFIFKLGQLRQYFKKGNKKKLGLGSHYKYTKAKDMWDDIAYKYYLNAAWAKQLRLELLPHSEEEWNLLNDQNKSGFFMVNPHYIGQTVKDVYSYDSSSSHISLLARKKFPNTQFQEELDDEKCFKIIEDDWYAWIGWFNIFGLDMKVNIPIDISKFGRRHNDNSYGLRLNSVDWQWFKEVFKWSKIEINQFYYCEQKEVPKNIAMMIEDLYERKDQQEDESFEKEIYKFRAELPYGQAIKRVVYEEDVVYNEDENNFQIRYAAKTFDDIINKLSNRKALPFSWGIWIVAYSRLELINLILRIGIKNVIYADTDCVKFIGEDNVKIVEEYNKEISDEFNRINNKRRMYMSEKIGRWKDEGKMKYFKAIGVKWYLTQDQNDKLELKCSGGNKAAILNKLNKSEKPFNEFSERLVADKMFKIVNFDRKDRVVNIYYQNFMDKEFKKEMEIISNGSIQFRR